MSPLSFSQTLSFFPLPFQNPKTLKSLKTLIADSMQTERGIEFSTGDSFYRRESSIARDLAVLSASIHRSKTLESSPQNSNPNFRILDAMSGCGVRSLRYLLQSRADFVHANDAFEGNLKTAMDNLSRVSRARACGERRWIVTCNDANRVMVESYLNREYFDVVDVDSFGSDSGFVRSAITVVRDGGLMYLTSTDGFSSGGHRPYNSLSSYGAYVRPMPYSNEVGLRMLIGGALREAVALGFQLSPLFSYYSYHGPVFRVMLQVARGKLHEKSHYGFICYCHKCGHSQATSWGDLGKICCPCSNDTIPRSLVVSGPLWTGPLHDAAFVTEMLNLAGEWKWAHTKEKGVDLAKLLNQMIDESDHQLPFGYIKLDEIARRAKINSPPLSVIINYLQKDTQPAGLILNPIQSRQMPPWPSAYKLRRTCVMGAHPTRLPCRLLRGGLVSVGRLDGRVSRGRDCVVFFELIVFGDLEEDATCKIQPASANCHI